MVEGGEARNHEAVMRASRALDEVVRYFDGRMPPAGFPLASVVKPAADDLRAALDVLRRSPQGEDHEAVRDRIAAELEAEVKRRNEWYGLDNWPFNEVVEFVLSRCPSPERNTEKLKAHADALAAWVEVLCERVDSTPALMEVERYRSWALAEFSSTTKENAERRP
jgi:hypothetical protein